MYNCTRNNGVIIEKPLYDTSDSKFKFCINSSTNEKEDKYEFKEIPTNEKFNYIISKNNSIYNLYTSDEKGNIIISLNGNFQKKIRFN